MNGLPQPYQVSAAIMSGLTPAELRDLNELLRIWQQKLTRNGLRNKYYSGKNTLKDLGISIPPQLRTVETVVGWPAKAVDALAVRSVFDGIAFGGDDDQGLATILDENDFSLMYSEAVTSELIHSCAFVTLSQGRGDEPEVLVNFYSAMTAAATWDVRRKRIRCGLTVADYETRADGQCIPLEVNYYTTDSIIMCRRVNSTDWKTERIENPVGRPLMEPLRYRPSLDRPFGKSRISRAVMSITDSAVRTCLRAEVSSELYTAPQRYLLGANPTDFPSEETANRAMKLKQYLGNMFVATVNENGDMPQYGQLAQMSMQPHTDYMRNLAARFAGETGVPISSLGVIHDNPASAEAMYAATEDLIIEAEALNEVNGRSLENVARMVLALRDGKPVVALDDAQLAPKANFRDAQRNSKAARGDYAVKVASAVPEYANTRFFWRDLGYSDADVQQIMRDLRYAQALTAASSTMATATSETEPEVAQQPEGVEGVPEADEGIENG